MEKKFVIVIPSYQNRDWCEKNILSALSQNYSNFRILFTDDCSTDGTAQEVERIVKEYDTKKRTTIIKNKTRLLAVKNIYNMVHHCADDEIIVIVDGDDWLNGPDVLTRLNKEYQKDIWLTYGQYITYQDNEIGCSCAIPKEIIDSGRFRRYRWCSSHLRTFYAWLYKKIKPEDLQYNGKWLTITGDLAIMFPMLEMAGPRQSFISDILYVYNYTSPLNDGKVNRQLQIELEYRIRSMVPYTLIK